VLADKTAKALMDKACVEVLRFFRVFWRALCSLSFFLFKAQEKGRFAH